MRKNFEDLKVDEVVMAKLSIGGSLLETIDRAAEGETVYELKVVAVKKVKVSYE